MAYSELIKNFEHIRDYMRQFYVYGFKSRGEYTAKSARSYDNERRRIESWMGDFMSFRQDGEGKTVFLSVDSRAIPSNPLYNAFKAKSFTPGDITLHFYILDILADGQARSVQEIVDAISEDYLSQYEDAQEMDVSSIRKKLKEYTALGLLTEQKRGRELVFRRSEDTVPLPAWAEALAFFSEEDPVGVIGSTLLDKLPEKPDCFRFRHYYMLHALNSEILLDAARAIGEHRWVELTFSHGGRCRALPIRIYISTQSGRQYILCREEARFFFCRADNVHRVLPGEQEPDWRQIEEEANAFRARLWGVSAPRDAQMQTEHIELRIHWEEKEDFILQRLLREKRRGSVEQVGQNTLLFTADVFDAMELLPWVRTFIGRIERFDCSNPAVTERFWEDLAAMERLYGRDADAV